MSNSANIRITLERELVKASGPDTILTKRALIDLGLRPGVASTIAEGTRRRALSEDDVDELLELFDRDVKAQAEDGDMDPRKLAESVPRV
jgi:hypothetical protein